MVDRRKPEWLKSKQIPTEEEQKVRRLMKNLHLNTVCREARCPNRVECFNRGTATFLIMGDTCTRRCRFCNVNKGKPQPLDKEEPRHVAEAVKALGLKYVVITSVTRDDLPDGGAAHFASVIRKVREIDPGVGIEVLIPDFQGDSDSLNTVLDARPDVLNHNVETVSRLYEAVRPGAVYERSLELLARAKTINPSIKTKSGLMVGLGETDAELYGVFADLRKAGCDLLTIGQYLAPTKEHYPVADYILPEKFEEYRAKALEMGFLDAASGPLVRSSYKAGEMFRGCSV
ncbi:MAG TPA: lipoyl synthase [Candidatus Mcinerneyibacteriales bacterium]|nr:lipoyl synthase [Candidatus Mcinerneyibacteriota bacterium]HOO60250.1 lipoyl synthase [Candidatus Mcinerneyibacteriales bacterium]HPJ70536.1 lipoyl synthase [Candidatus Mcinerneyibacteriales bacterium]HPQ89544.1 lipoyl synthase [Candidatus Mcinerneyibacteriales bacterium]